VAEVFLQAKKAYQKLTGVKNQLALAINATTIRKESHIGYGGMKVDHVAEVHALQQEVMTTWRKWLGDHKEEIQCASQGKPAGTTSLGGCGDGERPNQIIANAHVDPAKIEAFQNWLKQQMAELLTSKSQEELWTLYCRRGYEKGAGRAFDDYMPLKKKIPPTEISMPGGEIAPVDTVAAWYQGGRDQFLRDSFAQPVSVDRVKVLAGRSFDEMENVTTDMANRMSRALTDGLVQGKGRREVARDLMDTTDFSRKRANMVAQTELIRAHAEGQLDTMEKMGVKVVGVQVEWATANDDRVCPKCTEMDGKVFSIDKARGMIPKHPNCRCAFKPALPDWVMGPTKNRRYGWDGAKESLPRGWILTYNLTLPKRWDRKVGSSNSDQPRDEKGRFASAEHEAVHDVISKSIGGAHPNIIKQDTGLKSSRIKQILSDLEESGHVQKLSSGIYLARPATQRSTDGGGAGVSGSKDALGSVSDSSIRDRHVLDVPGVRSLGLSDEEAADRVRATFGKLEKDQNGLVSIHSIQQHSEMPLVDVHQGINHLRRKGELTGVGYEESKPKPEIIRAGIKHGAYVIGFVQRRTDNVFCASGPGGGVHPECTKQEGTKSVDHSAAEEKIKQYNAHPTFLRVESLLEQQKTTTAHQYRSKEGIWGEARSKNVHDPIISEFVKGAKYHKVPRLVLLIGPAGSGKTSVGRKYVKELVPDHVLVDADECKTRLPEYRGWNSPQVHDESGYLVRRIRGAAVKSRANILFDSTGRDSKHLEETVNEYHSKGYQIHVIHVTVPPEVAVERAAQRFLSNAFGERDSSKPPSRYTPLEFVGRVVNSKPDKTYKMLSENPKITSGISLDNNVAPGEDPKVLHKFKREKK
jgi:SPP1 gp7 family putative phage head morphogenesis protein